MTLQELYLEIEGNYEEMVERFEQKRRAKNSCAAVFERR